MTTIATHRYFLSDFVEIQRASFFKLLEKGLIEEFAKRNPITNTKKDLELFFYPRYYKLTPPLYTPTEAILKSKSYSSQLYLPVQLTDKTAKCVKLKWVHIGNLPLMTKRGHFILNGTARIIVNQMIRSPGIYYQTKTYQNYANKWSQKIETTYKRHYADLICQRGAWLRLEVDKEKLVWAQLKKGPKIPVLWLLIGMGLTEKIIFKCVMDAKNLLLNFESTEKREACNYVKNPSEAWSQICNLFSLTKTKKERTAYNTSFSLLAKLDTPNLIGNFGTAVASLKKKTISELGRKWVFNKFMNPRTYDLGKQGRLSINKKLGLSLTETQCTLTAQDLLFATDYLIKVGKGLNNIDDIDHLKNRRVRTSGELLQIQLGTALVRLEKIIRDKINKISKELDFQMSPKLLSLPLLKVGLPKVAGVRSTSLLTNLDGKVLRQTSSFGRNETLAWNNPQKRESPFTSSTEGSFSALASRLEQAIPKNEGTPLVLEEPTSAREQPKNEVVVLSLVPSQYSLGTSESKKLSLKQITGEKVGGSFSVAGLVETPKHSPKNEITHLSPSDSKEGFMAGLGGPEKAKHTRDSYLITKKLEKLTINQLINTKAFNGAVREFFGSSPLSQFMDQINPLAELTHKRRLSSMGPGGVTRDNATLAIRGIHPTHYGRICPVETPEGKNTGLVNSITTYARVNPQGLIETPFYKVFKGQVQKKTGMFFLSAEQEEKIKLAAADLFVSDIGFLPKSKIPVRIAEEFTKISREDVQYIGVSPVQMISIATSLIPFLEHDDANRALMGSNMQRQAVPLLRPERPIVGTGLEARAVSDSGHVLQAQYSGFVSYVSAEKIIVLSHCSLLAKA